jgi:hypothetical protein
MKIILNRIAENKSGFLLALAAVLIVGGWRVFTIVHRPAHWREAAAELFLPRVIHIMVSNNNTSLAYNQDADIDRGGGLYFYNIAAGKKILLYEQLPTDGGAKAFGWSPDDSFFVYSKPVPNYLRRVFCICDGQSCETLAELPCPDKVSQFTWLSGRSFAYLASQRLVEIEQNQDGKWDQSRFFKNVGTNAEYFFTATSASSVAWAASGKILEFYLSSGTSKTIWESPTNQLMDFTYSRETGEFILNCLDADGQGQYFIRFHSPATWQTNANMVSLPEYENKRPVVWDKDSPAYAYLADEDFDTFYIKTNADSKPIRLTWHGEGTENYLLNKNYFYVTGNLTNKPGIWRYDMASKSLENILSVRDQPFQYAKNPYPTTGMVTNAAGERKGYFLWQPAGIVPGRKYPLILTQTTPDWKLYAPVAANAGYYFAVAGRITWLDQSLQNWSSDVMNIREDLAKNPNIDTNQIFLFGISAETGYLSQLLADKPNLWKGVILPDPGGTPDLESLRGKQIFIITGKKAGNVEDLIKYQDEAFAAGIPLKLIFQEDERHTLTKFNSVRSRAEQLTEFLLQN